MTELTRAPQREHRLLTATSAGAFIGGFFAFSVPVGVLLIGGLAWMGGWMELLVLGPFAGGAVVAALVAYRYALAPALLVYAALYSPSFFVSLQLVRPMDGQRSATRNASRC